MFRKGALYNSFSIFLNWFKGHWFSNNCTAWVMKWSYSATIWKIIKLSFWRFGGDWLISIVVKWWVVKGVIFKGNHTISTIWIYYDLCQMRQYFSQLFRLGQTVLLWPTWRQLWQIVIFCSITGRSKVGLKKKIIKKKLFYRDILLSVLAFRSLGTKSNQPIRAHYFPYMPWFTIWTMFTKPSRIPGTFFYFWIRVNMKILAVTILTATKFWKEIAFRHFRHVIFMKKFAIVSFFTQTTQPMFTHYTIKCCWKVLPTLCTLVKFWKTPSERFPQFQLDIVLRESFKIVPRCFNLLFIKLDMSKWTIITSHTLSPFV